MLTITNIVQPDALTTAKQWSQLPAHRVHRWRCLGTHTLLWSSCFTTQSCLHVSDYLKYSRIDFPYISVYRADAIRGRSIYLLKSKTDLHHRNASYYWNKFFPSSSLAPAAPWLWPKTGTSSHAGSSHVCCPWLFSQMFSELCLRKILRFSQLWFWAMFMLAPCHTLRWKHNLHCWIYGPQTRAYCLSPTPDCQVCKGESFQCCYPLGLVPPEIRNAPSLSIFKK